MTISEKRLNSSEQARQNLSYVVGMYGGTIKILVDELKSPGTQSYRDGIIAIVERTLAKGEAIFKAHGERTYEDVLAEFEAGK